MAIPSIWCNFITTVYLDSRVVLSAWLWFPMKDNLLFEPVSKESVAHWRLNRRSDASGLAKLAPAVSVDCLSHTFYRSFISIIWVCQITRNTILIRCTFRITPSFSLSQLVWSKSFGCYENWQFITVMNTSSPVKLSSYLSEKHFNIISTVLNSSSIQHVFERHWGRLAFTPTQLSNPFTVFAPLRCAGLATYLLHGAESFLRS